MAYRHGGKALVVYYDGSAVSMSRAEMKAIDDQGGANHPFWKADAK
jgi:prepilin-type processing-associated H-X9-DG protein